MSGTKKAPARARRELSEKDQAGRMITSDDSPETLDYQEKKVAARYAVPLSLARVIAQLAYWGVRR